MPLDSWNDKVVPLIVDFMELAQATENLLHDPSVALMGSFKKTVDDLWWESVVNKNDETEYWTLAVEEGERWPNITSFAFEVERKRLPKGISTFEELCLAFGLELYAAEMGFLPAGVAGGFKKARLASVSLEAAEVISTRAKGGAPMPEDVFQGKGKNTVVLEDSTRHSKDPQWPSVRYS